MGRGQHWAIDILGGKVRKNGTCPSKPHEHNYKGFVARTPELRPQSRETKGWNDLIGVRVKIGWQEAARNVEHVSHKHVYFSRGGEVETNSDMIPFCRCESLQDNAERSARSICFRLTRAHSRISRCWSGALSGRTGGHYIRRQGLERQETTKERGSKFVSTGCHPKIV